MPAGEQIEGESLVFFQLRSLGRRSVRATGQEDDVLDGWLPTRAPFDVSGDFLALKAEARKERGRGLDQVLVIKGSELGSKRCIHLFCIQCLLVDITLDAAKK